MERQLDKLLYKWNVNWTRYFTNGMLIGHATLQMERQLELRYFTNGTLIGHATLQMEGQLDTLLYKWNVNWTRYFTNGTSIGHANLQLERQLDTLL